MITSPECYPNTRRGVFSAWNPRASGCAGEANQRAITARAAGDRHRSMAHIDDAGPMNADAAGLMDCFARRAATAVMPPATTMAAIPAITAMTGRRQMTRAIADRDTKAETIGRGRRGAESHSTSSERRHDTDRTGQGLEHRSISSLRPSKSALMTRRIPVRR